MPLRKVDFFVRSVSSSPVVDSALKGPQMFRFKPAFRLFKKVLKERFGFQFGRIPQHRFGQGPHFSQRIRARTPGMGFLLLVRWTLSSDVFSSRLAIDSGMFCTERHILCLGILPYEKPVLFEVDHRAERH